MVRHTTAAKLSGVFVRFRAPLRSIFLQKSKFLQIIGRFVFASLNIGNLFGNMVSK
jgi:hypothetical protein